MITSKDAETASRRMKAVTSKDSEANNLLRILEEIILVFILLLFDDGFLPSAMIKDTTKVQRVVMVVSKNVVWVLRHGRNNSSAASNKCPLFYFPFCLLLVQ